MLDKMLPHLLNHKVNVPLKDVLKLQFSLDALTTRLLNSLQCNNSMYRK